MRVEEEADSLSFEPYVTEGESTSIGLRTQYSTLESLNSAGISLGKFEVSVSI